MTSSKVSRLGNGPVKTYPGNFTRDSRRTALEDVPVWLAADTLVGQDGAKKALANPNLASRVILKTSNHRPEPVTEAHRSQRQHDHDD